MHLWSAISGVSACMARHTWLETGIGKLYPNTYVLLVGPPGCRKSTAIANVRNILKEVTPIRFAPDDTSGQRQGLIAAIEGRDDELSDSDFEAINTALAIGDITELEKIPLNVCPADRFAMYISASEFGSFIGQNSLDLTRFLIKMWDNESYEYRLKTSAMTLKDAQLNMIAGTTSTDIAALLPPEAMGQGFMSRIIMVHASRKYKKIAPSDAFLDTTKLPVLKDSFSWIANELRGPMVFTEAGSKTEKRIYMQDFRINDTRFIFYAERRHQHLIKVAMALTAMRQSQEITAEDVEEADIILGAAEETMPDALGEYGLSPIAAAKQKMAEFIQHAKGPVSMRVLWMVMQRDMRQIDFRNALNDMVNAGKITQVDTNVGQAFIYNDAAQQALDLLAEEIEGDTPNDTE